MCIDPIQLSFEEIKAEAEKFLEKYHPTNTIPIPIEEIIDNKLRIDIIPIPGLKKALQGYDLDIDGFISTDFKSISVDDYVQQTIVARYKFTLAHEIGHRELHQYFFKKLQINAINDWKRVVNDMPDWPVRIIEHQANIFAGLILVPSALLKQEFPGAKVKAEKILEGVSFGDGFMKELIIGYLAETFAVSQPCMKICLERDNLFDLCVSESGK